MILDADVIIRAEKGVFDLSQWAASYPDEQFELAAITVAELWQGVERAAAKYQSKRRQFLQTIFASCPIIPYTEQTAYVHTGIWGELVSSGQIIGYYDMIVAATALERGSAVATFNVRHYSQVKGLTVIKPE
jgi:tRNA(fMet)-specific endonuclease VapC